MKNLDFLSLYKNKRFKVNKNVSSFLNENLHFIKVRKKKLIYCYKNSLKLLLYYIVKCLYTF